MITLNKSSEPDPFTEPLAPLPASTKDMPEPSNVPKAVRAMAPAMEPERFLPSEDEIKIAAVERLEPERELAVTESRPAPCWKFWKRPSKRDQQLETLRQGASEMVGLMRSIRDHLEDESGAREGLRRSLSPLPLAVESLKSMSESQADTGRVLSELRTTIERRAEKDTLVIKSLNRIGNTMSNVDETFSLMDRTLSSMDQSNQRTATTMEKLGERVTDSGRFMSETFARLRDAEREFTDHVTRSSRRSNFAMLAVCSILLLSIFAVAFMFKENRELLSAVQNNGALVVQVPVTEAPAERVAIFEDLNQVDDGIGEPDREIVKTPVEGDDEEERELVVPVNSEEDPLLSVNKLPRRE
ncbi:MAG: hypothetical protein ACKJSK_12880 [Roseibacillus sp.]